MLYNEVVTGIHNLKKGKSAGFDGIKSEYYQIDNPNFIHFIHEILLQIFDSGVYPTKWSKCMIIPLYKKGDTSEVPNYRGISLLNVMSKIFSQILQSRLKVWCDMHNSIPEEQAGFRQIYSTIDNIF